MKNKRSRIQTLTLCLVALLAGSASTASPGKLRVLSRTVSNSEKRDFIVRSDQGTGTDKVFHEVACYSGSEEHDLHCYPVELPNGDFILVDCFGHDSIDSSCRIEKFKADGKKASGFKTPFPNRFEELVSGKSGEAIIRIQSLKVLKDGKIRIEGEFISPLVKRTRAQMAKEEKELEKKGIYGPVGGALGTVLLEANGAFLRFDPKKNG